MATYKFEAMDTTGGEVKDSIEAASEEEAQQKIRQMGYFVTRLVAVAKHPKCFDRLYVNMLKAGEAGGALKIILKRFADFKEKSQSLARRIKGAMIYPIVVLSVAFLILAGIMIWIIPKFEKIFVD